MQLSDEQNTSSYTLIDPIVVSRDKQHDPMASEITTLTLESKKRTNCYFNATWSLTFIGTKKVEGLRFMIVVGNYTSKWRTHFWQAKLLIANQYDQYYRLTLLKLLSQMNGHLYEILSLHIIQIFRLHIYFCALYMCVRKCVFFLLGPPLHSPWLCVTLNKISPVGSRHP